jgi:hypothetical protein
VQPRRLFLAVGGSLVYRRPPLYVARMSQYATFQQPKAGRSSTGAQPSRKRQLAGSGQ